jgi:hypothetical protein
VTGNRNAACALLAMQQLAAGASTLGERPSIPSMSRIWNEESWSCRIAFDEDDPSPWNFRSVNKLNSAEELWIADVELLQFEVLLHPLHMSSVVRAA